MSIDVCFFASSNSMTVFSYGQCCSEPFSSARCWTTLPRSLRASTISLLHVSPFFFLRRQYWPVRYRSRIHNHITDLFILDPCNIGVSVHINPYASPETGVNCVRRLFWIHRDEYVGSMIGVYTVYRLTKSFQITDVTFQFIFNILMYRHSNFVSTTRLYQLSAFLTSGFYCILITTYTIIYLILLIIMSIVTRFLNIYSEIAVSFVL